MNRELLLSELESIGYIPADIKLTPKAAKALSKADARACFVAIRTIKNKTYKNQPIERKRLILEKIFTRHRIQVLKSLIGSYNG